MDLSNSDQSPDLPQEVKRAFTASGWRKYQMRQREQIAQDHIASESSEESAQEA